MGNEEALNRIITCRVAEEQQHGSDHLPIETTLALCIEKPQTMQPFNYARTDWKELNNKLEQYLPRLSILKTHADIDKYTEELIKAIMKALEETTPHKRPSPHSKRWWNENIGILRHEANRLRNIYRRTKSNIDKAAAERAILAARNDTVDNLNEQLLASMNGEVFTSYSADKAVDEGDAETYATEYLNTVNLSNLPPHELKLKIGAPVILLHNLSPSTGLCNGTRLHVARISQDSKSH